MDLFAPLPCSLRQLQYLVAVADLGGFGRAAVQCHVSQPSLSAQVAQAEEALGVQVFERNRRGVRLSAPGAVVVDRARQVLLAARDLSDAARQQADPFQGRLRLGVIPTVCPYLLPEVSPALRRAYPRLSIVWVEEKTATLVDRIAEGTLDGAIIALDGRLGALESFTIRRDPFVLAAAPGHPLVQPATPLPLRALDGAEVLLLDDGHCFRDQALAVCAGAGAREREYRATSLATLVQMVASGGAVTLLPSLALPVENRRGQLAIRPFARPAPARVLALAWRRGSALRPVLRATGETLRRLTVRGD